MHAPLSTTRKTSFESSSIKNTFNPQLSKRKSIPYHHTASIPYNNTASIPYHNTASIQTNRTDPEIQTNRTEKTMINCPNHPNQNTNKSYQQLDGQSDLWFDALVHIDHQYDALVKEVQNLLNSQNSLSKLQRIRISQWMNKISIKPNNLIWRQNRNFYLQVLLEMLEQSQLLPPFLSVPPDGPLPKLTIFDVPYPIRVLLQQKMTTNKYSARKQTSKLSRNSFRKHGRNYNQLSIGNAKHQHIFHNQYYQRFSHTNEENEENKQNISILMNTVDIKRKLFHSKEKSIEKSRHKNKRNSKFCMENTMETEVVMKSQHYRSQHQEFMKQLNQYTQTHNVRKVAERLSSCKYSFDKQYIQQPSILVNEEGFNEMNKEGFNELVNENKQAFDKILAVFKFLCKNYDQLCHQITYKELIQKIVIFSTKMGINIEQINLEDEDSINFLDKSQLSEKSSFRKTSRQIKDKLMKTDEETLQFMTYLSHLKNKKNSREYN